MMGQPSRYHVGKQHNGRGWMIIRLSALHAGLANTTATVIECDLAEDAARARLAQYRREETAA